MGVRRRCRRGLIHVRREVDVRRLRHLGTLLLLFLRIPAATSPESNAAANEDQYKKEYWDNEEKQEPEEVVGWFWCWRRSRGGNCGNYGNNIVGGSCRCRSLGCH